MNPNDPSTTIPTPKNNYATPVAIVIAGLLIALAVIYRSDTPLPTPTENEPDTKLEAIRPVDAKTDHIRGDINAPIKIVEYSDLECPFCKRFHNSMKEVFAKYGETGQIAWVYRHFPLDSLHQQARPEAIATECAAYLGGNEAFWQYLDKVFATTPSNDGLDLALLPDFAAEIGLDKAKFTTCLQDPAIADKVDADYQNAVDAGGRGTPFPIVINAKGERQALAGALQFPALEAVIKEALK